MIDDTPVGAALDRDLAPGEAVEHAIDHFIQVRHDRRVEEGEKEREAEQAWKESTRVYNEKRLVQARYEWHLHHTAQAARLRRTLESLIAHHEERAEELRGDAA